MRKIYLVMAVVVFSLIAVSCGKSDKENDKTATKAQVTEAQTEQETEAETEAEKVDFASLDWEDAELTCYDYDDCYMSFKYPSIFKKGSEESSGLQYLGYNYNPENEEAKPNESPYGIYVYFNQGSFGAKKGDLEADVEGGFEERDLGGRKVFFGQNRERDPNTNSYVFNYYVQYEEDDYSRIWFIVCDTEEDGVFRKMFEESISFTKK